MKKYGKAVTAILLSVLLATGASGPVKASETSAGKGRELGSSYVVGNRAFIYLDKGPKEETASGLSGQDSSEETTLEKEKPRPMDKISKRAVTEEGRVASRAYYKSRGLSGYVFPEAKSIGELSYARSNLKEAVLPYGLTSIGYGAFYHCDGLSRVQIPVTVTEIAPKAFAKSAWLESWLSADGDDFLVVGDGILLAYRGTAEDVVIPDNVKKIGPEVFMQDTRIKRVTLPDSVTEIGEAAFYNCSNLTEVAGGKGLEKIADRALAGCPVSGFMIGSSIQKLGRRCIDFDDTKLQEEDKYVVFEAADTLPEISFEESAEKLGNTSYRDVCLKGVSRIEHPDGQTEEAYAPYLTKAELADGLGVDNLVNGFSLTADFSGKGAYELTVEEGDGGKVFAAYESLYGEEPEGDRLTVRFSLLDTVCGIPIEQANKGVVTLHVTLPDYLKHGDILILTTDADGQLESVEYTGEEGELQFSATRFSDYVFLSVGNSRVYGQSRVNGGQAVIERNKDFGIE